MSGHRVIAVRGDVALATLAGVLGHPSSADMRPTDALVAFLAPLHDDEFATERVGDWTVAWSAIGATDESPAREQEQRQAALRYLSRGGAALHWLTESASGTDGFDWYVDGALARSWWMVEGTVVDRVGAPVAGEPAEGLDAMPPSEVDEWVIAGVVEALVAPWDELVGRSYRRVARSKSFGG